MVEFGPTPGYVHLDNIGKFEYKVIIFITLNWLLPMTGPCDYGNYFFPLSPSSPKAIGSCYRFQPDGQVTYNEVEDFCLDWGVAGDRKADLSQNDLETRLLMGALDFVNPKDYDVHFWGSPASLKWPLEDYIHYLKGEPIASTEERPMDNKPFPQYQCPAVFASKAKYVLESISSTEELNREKLPTFCEWIIDNGIYPASQQNLLQSHPRKMSRS